MTARVGRDGLNVKPQVGEYWRFYTVAALLMIGKLAKVERSLGETWTESMKRDVSR